MRAEEHQINHQDFWQGDPGHKNSQEAVRVTGVKSGL